MNPGNEVVLWKDEALGITYYVREGGKKPVIHFYFSVDGKRIRLSSRTTDRKQAAIVAQEKFTLAKEGKQVKGLKFKQASKKFLEHKKNRVSSSTYENYKSILSYVDQFLGDHDVKQISNATITMVTDTD